MTSQSQAKFPQLDSGLAVSMFQQGEDPIECINKEMAFLSAIASRFPPSNNQLRTSSNPRNKATIQDGKVTIQQVQGRQHQSYAGIGNKGIATTSKGNIVIGLSRLMKGIWRDSIDDLDAYDSDCDDLSSAKAVLMANLSSCDPEVLSKVPYYDSYQNDMINQDVQEMQYSEQTHVDDFEDNEIYSGSNIILYTQYLQESQDAVIQDTNPSAPNDLLVLSLVEQMTDHVAHLDKENQTNKMSQEKHRIIRKLKERIKSLSGNDSVENVKKDIDEIETINIELEHSVAKLLSENENLRKEREHLKSVYKDQFDSIRKTRVQSKEYCDSLIAQINAKSIENSDLNAQLQEKLDIEPISPRLKNNRDAHEVYIEKTIEHTNTLHGFELLVYVSHTCPNLPKPIEKLVDVTPINKEKRIRFVEPVTSSNNIPKQIDSLTTNDSNKPLMTSTGVKPTTSASRSKPSGNTKNNRITRPSRSNQKNKVEDHIRKVKSSLNKINLVSEPISNALFKHYVRNAKFEYINKKKKAWKPTGKVFTDVGYKWKPTRRFFTIVGNSCPLTRITPKKIVHLKETTSKSIETPKPEVKVYSRRPKKLKLVGSSKKAKIVESKTVNNSESTHLWGSNAINVPCSSSLVNDRLSRSSSGSRDTNLSTISLDDMLKTSSICLLSKASKTKSWLWHRRLSHLNFGTLNKLAKDGLAQGIPKVKFQKDHVCSACALGKSKKSSHQPKAEDTNQEKLYLLHMDLYGPMRVESINGKKYILVIVDDYSRFTWVKFLRSKDEAHDAIIK
ncbi:retrovirus-related pol polyprotein from transposon TNT 1-94 [Tanacetum coccineum]